MASGILDIRSTIVKPTSHPYIYSVIETYPTIGGVFLSVMFRKRLPFSELKNEFKDFGAVPFNESLKFTRIISV